MIRIVPPTSNFCVGNNEKPAVYGRADRDKATFVDRMCFVGESRRERIVEDGCRFAEVHTMLGASADTTVASIHAA